MPAFVICLFLLKVIHRVSHLPDSVAFAILSSCKMRLPFCIQMLCNQHHPLLDQIRIIRRQPAPKFVQKLVWMPSERVLSEGSPVVWCIAPRILQIHRGRENACTQR